MNRQGNLLKVVGRNSASRRRPNLLDCRQEQSDQDGDDDHHHEQLDERKRAAATSLRHDPTGGVHGIHSMQLRLRVKLGKHNLYDIETHSHH